VTVMLNVKMALMKIQNFVEVRQHSSLNTILSYLFFLDPFAFWIPKPFKSFSFPFFFTLSVPDADYSRAYLMQIIQERT
jgi:hypothetical protein